jgi:hypothetical protein
MNGPIGGFLAGVAVFATVIAVWADDNFSLAIPAAIVAVVSAGLLFVDAFLERAPVNRPLEGHPAARDPGWLRTAFRSGHLGREAIADLLDRLERAGPHPDLPGRRAEETKRLGRMHPDEFREYLRQRLDDLESRS